jgi:hypothetical protein
MMNFDGITEATEIEMARGTDGVAWVVTSWDMYWLGLCPTDKPTAEAIGKLREREGYRRVHVVPSIGGYTAGHLLRMVEGYMEALLFTNHDENEVPLDSMGYNVHDFMPDAEEKIWHDCAVFLSRVGRIIPDERMHNAGTDFHLTRSGHGSGFWDGDWDDLPGDAAKRLTEAAGDEREQIEIVVDQWGNIHATGGYKGDK